ncbi:19794_t:CDS:2 [Gigaspora margarita]|uniref:19794_t:CDS:1 n=1 Tax=Gigaspora margarita TaxID=4874 RepID=A0ABN7UUD5_GIGMA|nr:19794_t:CDS:2 [Gigaspora margarita]
MSWQVEYVKSKDGRIIIFGGNSANSSTRGTTLRASPDIAVLNTNVSPYEWSIPNIPSANLALSLCYHSAEIYNNTMIIAFGLVTSNILSSTLILNKNIYLFDVQNYAWITSTTLTSGTSTSSTTTSKKPNTSHNTSTDKEASSNNGSNNMPIEYIHNCMWRKKRPRNNNIIEIPGSESYLTKTSDALNKF